MMVHGDGELSATTIFQRVRVGSDAVYLFHFSQPSANLKTHNKYYSIVVVVAPGSHDVVNQVDHRYLAFLPSPPSFFWRIKKKLKIICSRQYHYVKAILSSTLQHNIIFTYNIYI